MESDSKKRIPIAEGIFTMPDSPQGPLLLASRCVQCREVLFPKERVCLRCGSLELDEILLSREGILHTFTVVRQQPPIYKGQVPYAIGVIELPEKVRAACLLSGGDFDRLQIGMLMRLVIERLHDDEQGNEIVCHKFAPVV